MLCCAAIQINIAGVASNIKGSFNETLQEVQEAIINVEAIIVNTLKPGDGLAALDENFANELSNKLNLDFFNGGTIEDLTANIDAIISNEISGIKNKISNAVEIRIGNTGANPSQSPGSLFGNDD